FKTSAPETGMASIVRPVAVIGNCSMSAPADKGGSLPRIYQAAQSGFEFLQAQYLNNNLFVYPEHQDHDAGWNGRGGWGDLLPANNPCFTISQGSSFTDQPFVRAFLSTAAAFPPETQALLLKKRLLAPTLQALLRQCYGIAKSDEDYFTGKAHPAVFDGSQLDEGKMVLRAHIMTPSLVPPVALLGVVRETQAVPNQAFFEEPNLASERLGTVPSVISRVFRRSSFVYEMEISAKHSFDVQGRPLRYKWAVLEGDASRISIKPSEDSGTATIAVAWHPTRRATSGINSQRVDIGVFANNGLAWSAPAFVSFYMLPNEARFYSSGGRLEEICYEATNPDLGLPSTDDLRWLSLGRRFSTDKRHPGIALLMRELSEVSVVRLESLSRRLAEEQATWRSLSADPGKKAAAEKALAGLKEKLRNGLAEPIGDGRKSLLQAFEDGVKDVSAIPDLYLAGQDVIPSLVKGSSAPNASDDFNSARQRLVDYQIYLQRAPGLYALALPVERLTAGERYHLSQFHLTVLRLALFPEFLDRSEAPAFVDERLTTRKAWRDVYQYSKDGARMGWTRYANGRTYEFDAKGRLLPQGRNGPAVEVKYVRDAKKGRLIFAPK
ncbi:MAG: hypothetical protein ACOYMN_03035, partial [Roseimicrobium sp.]